MSLSRIIAVVDSDSYLKFACATLDGLEDWERRVVLLRSPTLPTTEQIRAATSGTFLEIERIPIVASRGLKQMLTGADVVLAAATGPIAEEVFIAAARLRPRPALVSALPGVALPATVKAMRYRAIGDAFITHSYAERRAFIKLAEELGSGQRMLVSRLPFLRSQMLPEPVDIELRSVVFAPQAKVPETRADRVAILLGLAELGRRRPRLDISIKLRARAGEPQTHVERYPYEKVWADMVSEGTVTGDEVVFLTGAMSACLTDGTALVTVSSTAALEAIDLGLPVLILSDFGVTDEMLNRVFTASGLLGTLRDLEAGHFFHADSRWLRENYFHPPAEPLSELLGVYAKSARNGRLALNEGHLRTARRRRWRLRLRTALPVPALKLVFALRRCRRAHGPRFLRL